MNRLLTDPPKQVLPDNTVQEWRGRPNLVDVTRTIDIMREERATEKRRREGAEVLKEMRDLQRRKDAGEEFYGLADVLRAVPLNRLAKPMPDAENKPFEDLDLDKNKSKLAAQAEAVARKHQHAE